MSSSNSNDEVRTTPLWLAPFQSIGREFAVILQNTRAFTGGVIGSLALSAGLAALVLIGNAKADEADEESEMLDIEFVPGALVRLGEKRDEKIPEKLIIEETVAAEEVAEETITKDEKTPPPPETKKKDDIKETTEKGKVPPDPNKKDAKVSDKNRDKNTPHNDLPTVRGSARRPLRLRGRLGRYGQRGRSLGDLGDRRAQQDEGAVVRGRVEVRLAQVPDRDLRERDDQRDADPPKIRRPEAGRTR
jgi:outer membrane biosynthesis protein TonB